MKKLLAASLCMFVVAACAMGGAKKSAMTAQPPMAVDSGGAPSPGGSPREQLDALFAQVEQERQEMQLPEPQMQGAAPAPTQMSQQPQTSKTDPTCKPAPSETCQTSCKLSDSICENSGKICKLAEELADDDANAKCAKSEKTCKTSHEKCCGCML
jgi:hypothetical protein